MASSSKRYNPTKCIDTSVEYVKDYTEQEAEEYLKFMDSTNVSNKCEPQDIQISQDIEQLYMEDLAKTSRECHFTHKQKSDLSILLMKDSILSMIETNSVVVIQGPTGCGKTTQIPQYILNSNMKKKLYCNIIVTQPRRVAAISIAKRVSQEGDWPLGSLVGYRVGMKQKMSPATRLTYCTTEILLQDLIHQKHMLNYTHVILDEIHERDQELDFLLLVIKKLLQTNSKLVKVILMSATIDVTRFAEYFSTRVGTKLVPTPIIKIPEKKFFQTNIYYLDEIQDLGMIPEVSPSEPKVTPAMVNFCAKVIVALDKIDTNDDTEAEIGKDSNSSSQRHTVLIFLPGIYEIEELYAYLSSEYHKSKLWDLIVLHSLISSDEQQCIFYKSPPNYRRIILSTNIAESSITVPDVKYVIDFCLLKILTVDPISNYQSLQLCWASKTNCIQRAGRAGRVMDGRVYRLVPRQFYHNVFDNEGTPEMLRAPLANVVLRAKILDLGNPRSLLALSLDPPSLRNLSKTILSLKEVGALIEENNMTFQPFDGNLTDLGRIMGYLPLDTRISKLIMLGHVFGILRDAVVLGASMALKDMFTNKRCHPSVSSYMVKRKWARETNSDCIASLNIYKTWQNEKANRRLVSYQAEKQWAQRNGVQLQTLRELDALVNEIMIRLTKWGIKETVGVNKVIWEGWDYDFVLQVILAGAFYPNYFIKRPQDMQVYKESVTRDLASLNPMRTVFLRGWPMKQPGYLYARKLQEIFSLHQGIAKKQIMISFDGSKRVCVQFREKETMLNDENLYKISDFVYKAVKMRQCDIPIEIGLLNVRQAQEKSKDQNLDRFKQTVFFHKRQIEKRTGILPKIRPKLPSLDVTFIPLSIKNIISPGYFWAIINDEDTQRKISTIKVALNGHSLREFNSRPEISTLVAAPIEKDGSLTYHRAIIEDYTSEIANIFFIDHGYSSRVRSSDLRSIDDITSANLHSLAFQCTLALLRPSNQAGNLQRQWSKISQDCFKRQIHKSEKILGKIYSVVDSIVNLELIIVNKNEEHFNINEYLIEEGYAVKGEESYFSQYNHDLRADISVINAMSPEQKLFYEERQYNEDNLLEYPDPPKEEDCDSSIKLEGPFSPLEVGLVQLTAAGRSKRAVIDINSTNSVLLDENLDGSTRLLVAQNVNQVAKNDYLVLRNTTLLPNIRGLTALLALIFAPRIELRRNLFGTYYTGALCGLGPMDDCTDRAIFPDHDMAILFDVEISIDDLREVNKLRYWMNVGITQLQHENLNYNDDDNERMINCQNRIKYALLELRDRCRKSQNPVEDNEFNKWNRYHTSMFLHPARGARKNEIYPLHKALELQERNDKLEETVTHLMELYRLVNDDIRKVGNMDVFCKLCKVQTFGLLHLRGHLDSEQHLRNEQILQIPNIRDYYY